MKISAKFSYRKYNLKQPSIYHNNTYKGKTNIFVQSSAGGEGGAGESGELVGYMSGGKPVWVAVMNWPSACMRGLDVHMGLSSSKEVTSPSRSDVSWTLFGQRRMVCVKDSGAELQQGHVSLGSSLH